MRKKIEWSSRLTSEPPFQCLARYVVVGIWVGALLIAAGTAAAQAPEAAGPSEAIPTHFSVPAGYSSHQAIEIGGHISGVTGSPAMYSTLVNQQSGPRILSQTFRMRALPGTKHGLVDSLTAISGGFGGDPYSFAKLNFSKGTKYDFSGLFRRDRQYFDYDLLGNPNITTGKSIPIGLGGAAGSFAWPQLQQSPQLFNTVRRMTDTHLTVFPLSKITYRAGYSQNIFQGPSLTSSGYQIAGSYALLLQELQRNSTDDFMGAIDWKPIEGTKLTFEEQIDHFKGNSYFTLAPSSLRVQEADGTKAAFLISLDSQAPYAVSACNAASMMNPTTILYAPQTSGGLPVIDPACAVALNYLRTQPTRIIYPTEIFRLQSTSIKNVSMNGDVRYTNANMNLPNYYESFQGLTKANRSYAFTANANEKRQVIAIDYGIAWQVVKAFSLSDQVNFSNARQPGTSITTSGTTLSVAAGTPQTVNNPTLVSSASPITPPEGSADIGEPLPGYFGQRYVTNNLTGSWDVAPSVTLALTYRYGTHVIAEGSGNPGNVPVPVGEQTDGTVTINENGGIFNAAFRPVKNWQINGSVEVLYHDNAFTPVSPRQTKQYRVHTRFRPKSWAIISAAFNDRERHNNTNNAQDDVTAGATPYYGPINHVDYSRVASVSADLAPSEHYGLNLSYSYSDVYAATNICYASGAAGASVPGAATAPGTNVPPNVYPNGVCGGVFGHGGSTLVDWYARDFMDAPTQYGMVALSLSPAKAIHSNIGYTVSAVNGTRFFNDARDVSGSLVSTYQSPFVSLAWTIHPGLIWKAQYNFYGYGEGGPSGAPYCSASTSATATVVPCDSATLTGPTGLTEPSSGLTAPRNFHANNVTFAFRYEF